ncbi:MAG: hypothetical protein AABY02_02705, partial [Nanoarchaeota archaeon]
MAMINRTRELFFSIITVLSIFILLLGIQGSYAKTPGLTSFSKGLTDEVDPPILRAVPEQSNWIADGTTLYKITIIGDSRPMNPSATLAIDFAYLLPEVAGYVFNLANVVMIPQNDFFAGWSTSNWQNGNLIGRLISQGSLGPVNLEGNVVEMWFSVSRTGAGPENIQTSLGIDPDPEVTYFRRPNSDG